MGCFYDRNLELVRKTAAWIVCLPVEITRSSVICPRHGRTEATVLSSTARQRARACDPGPQRIGLASIECYRASYLDHSL
jgi:hypothetical protein